MRNLQLYNKVMSIDVFINVRPYQIRVASVEKGQLKQIFLPPK